MKEVSARAAHEAEDDLQVDRDLTSKWLTIVPHHSASLCLTLTTSFTSIAFFFYFPFIPPSRLFHPDFHGRILKFLNLAGNWDKFPKDILLQNDKLRYA